MAKLFVHGVPDTAHVWHHVRERLPSADHEALSLPGFGCPVPPGFDCSKEAYAQWLIDEIERRETPVDLVGHDWGAFLVLRVVCLRPDLVRSWVYGSAPLDPDYRWHGSARIWQTRVVGELFMAITPAFALRRAMIGGGVPAGDAAQAAARIDRTMKAAILKLYRSAVQVGAEWSRGVEDVRVPGLVLWGLADPYAPPDIGRRLAEKTGVRFVGFSGCGHWWPAQAPQEVAGQLATFWSHPGS